MARMKGRQIDSNDREMELCPMRLNREKRAYRTAVATWRILHSKSTKLIVKVVTTILDFTEHDSI